MPTGHFVTFVYILIENIMLSVSQPVEIGKNNGRILVEVTRGSPYASNILALPKANKIQGCSIPPECLPPGLRLHLRRNQFDVIGVALHRGHWGGTLCIDVGGQLVRTQLIFVVR